MVFDSQEFPTSPHLRLKNARDVLKQAFNVQKELEKPFIAYYAIVKITAIVIA